MTTFIGIDLAWKSNRNPTGAAVLHGDRDGACLIDLSPPLCSIGEIRSYIERFESTETVVAIDAPLIMPNKTGQRLCERLIGQRYGARHASCHTSNQTLYPDALSVRLAAELESRGYRHGPDAKDGRIVLEVYPHAALVALFDLPRVLKYKKGSVATRCEGLRHLQRHLERLEAAEPPLISGELLRGLLRRDPSELRGAGRKSFEDSLDAVVCAYVGFNYWVGGADSTEMFGSIATGYIANPKLLKRASA